MSINKWWLADSSKAASEPWSEYVSPRLMQPPSIKSRTLAPS